MTFHGPDQTPSLWEEIPKLKFPSLLSDTTCDICVVGGGITGLTVAYQCLLEGHRVVLIDRDQIGSHETGRTSAHLSNALDDGFQELKRLHGSEGMRLAFESHTQAIDQIEDIVNENGIDCDFQRVDGFLFLDSKTPREFLTQELACIHEAGGDNIDWRERFPNGIFSLGPCLRFPRQAQFHPLKYLNGLAEAIERLGGKIYSQTTAVEIKGGRNAHVTTARGQVIHADSLVIATNVPINDIVTMHTKMAAYRSYLIGVRIPPGWFEPALLWDTADPYHYVRMVKRKETCDEILLIGGADHRTGQAEHPEERFELLKTWTRDLLNIEPDVVSKWSGQIIEPIDGLAYIGHNPGDYKNVFIATGDSGHGLTHGTIAAMMFKEMVNGNHHPWEKLYHPARLHLRGLDKYFGENLNTATQYGDWVSSGDVDSTKDIRPGTGAIVRDGLNKVAAYRDEHGVLHTFTAVCPHLKGIVHWNEVEHTWDCPCHGSRFSCMGHVLNGPATEGLAPVKEPSAEKPIDVGLARNYPTPLGFSPDVL